MKKLVKISKKTSIRIETDNKKRTFIDSLENSDELFIYDSEKRKIYVLFDYEVPEIHEISEDSDGFDDLLEETDERDSHFDNFDNVNITDNIDEINFQNDETKDFLLELIQNDFDLSFYYFL